MMQGHGKKHNITLFCLGETWASSTDGAPLIEDSDVPPELRIAGT